MYDVFNIIQHLKRSFLFSARNLSLQELFGRGRCTATYGHHHYMTSDVESDVKTKQTKTNVRI